ncbi:HAD-IIB family hydrolase [Mycoplasmopsis columbinasalis]|uniref:COF family HAD hydrolase protein n=1 Tax=Mycoplasmopsis columbinasalis TaxID=114880 RepID=A0A449BB35_9BACT|nr:HAD-IIB family hydrolase [Mycoplasmopsis columbinasalis]VEU78395.1 COF family HAD hydrolase protein [Mycoplasmopsis columbinasalis]
MKKSYKAVFVDLDGTFLDNYENYENPVSQVNLDMARELNKNSHFIISTGRTNSDFVMNLARQTNSKYVICQNGAIIVDQNNNILRNNLISSADANAIKKYLEAKQIHYTINGLKKIFTCRPEAIKLNRPWAKEFVKLPYIIGELEMPINRLLAFGLATETQTCELAAEIESQFPNLRAFLVSNGLSLEITSKESSKGIGNQFVCDLLGISPTQALHIGDSGNDTCVKEQGFDLVLLDNALDSIKSYADHIGEHFRNGGFAKTIKKICEL